MKRNRLQGRAHQVLRLPPPPGRRDGEGATAASSEPDRAIKPAGSPAVASSTSGGSPGEARSTQGPARSNTSPQAVDLQAAKRGDAPPVFTYTRGCKRTALDIARDPERRAEAVAELEARMYARTSRGPRAQRKALWIEILAACGHPPAPLTPEAYREGTAVLLAAGYRSASMIAEQALVEHVEQGGALTDLLRRQRTAFRRACARGRGPPKRAGAWPVELSVKLPAGEDPLVKGGPAFPRRFIVCCCWWLTREIEAGNAAQADVTALQGTTAWALPASKADTTAMGTARSHGCACGRQEAVEHPLPLELCPACQLSDQLQYVSQRWGEGLEVPLWPDASGKFCSKQAIVDTIVAAATWVGLPTRTPAGAEAWGGHSLRRGGAQYLAQQGIDTWRIQALARHSSSAILAYLEEANLVSLRGLSTDAALGRSIESVRAELANLAASTRATHLEKLQESPQGEKTAAKASLRTSLGDLLHQEQMLPAGAERYVVNTRPEGKVHVIRPDAAAITYCRWAWESSSHHLKAHSPLGFRQCTKCRLRQAKEDTLDAEPAGTSSPSSESEP